MLKKITYGDPIGDLVRLFHVLRDLYITYLSLKIPFFFICNGNVSHMEEVADMNLLFLTLEEKPPKSSFKIFISP